MFVVAGLAGFAIPARAQCTEARLRAYDEIPAALATGDADSVLVLVDAWREVCGPRAEIVRIEVLALLWADRYDEWVVDTAFVDHLVTVQRLERARPSNPPEATIPVLRESWEFAEYSRALAADVARYTPPGTEDYLLARFYAGEHEDLWRRVGVEPYASTRLGQVIAVRREELSGPFPRIYGLLAGGVWSGVSDLESIGRRGVFGGAVGTRVGPFAARVHAELQAGNADEDYVVNDDRQLYLTDRFTGGSVVIEPGLDLPAPGPLGLEAVVGIGWSGVEALEAESVDGQELPPVWIHAFTRTLGGNLRWEFDRRFVELQVRRTWSDFRAGRAASALDGGAWVVRLGFGLHVRPSRDETLAEILAPPAPPR